MNTFTPPYPLPGLRIGEVILRTARCGEMKSWYRTVLAVDPFYEHEPPEDRDCADSTRFRATELRMCFFRLTIAHPYQQVIGLFNIPGSEISAPPSCGLHHVQFADGSPTLLAHRYAILKAAGIFPFRSVDHGPTTSLYYNDPDNNVIEVAAPNFAEIEAFFDAVASPEFQRNPSGLPLDPEVFASEHGVGMELLAKR